MTWSIVNFTGEEIIQLALEIEKAGGLFYRKAAANVNDTAAKEVFNYLAKEEEKHITDFEKLGEKLAKEFVPNESYVGEYGEYLRSIINNHIFNLSNVDNLINQDMTKKESINIALTFEKDSIIIFQEFKNFVSQSGQEVIQDLINEEKEHVKKLGTFYQECLEW